MKRCKCARASHSTHLIAEDIDISETEDECLYFCILFMQCKFQTTVPTQGFQATERKPEGLKGRHGSTVTIRIKQVCCFSN